MKYSIVIPIYNSEKHLKELFEDIKDNFKSIDEYEIICVEDCSKDNSFKLLKEIAVNDSRVKIIKNYKNLGQGTSILNGINEASGEFIITIDDDMSFKFSEISKLFIHENEPYDVKIGIAISENKSWFTNKIRKLFYKSTNKSLLNNNLPGSYRVIRSDIAKLLTKIKIQNPSVSNLLFLYTDKVLNVFLKQNNYKSKSRYTFSKKLELAINNYLISSINPFKYLVRLLILVLIFSFGLTFYFVLRYLLGFNTLQGWTSVFIGILISFSVIFLVLIFLIDIVIKMYNLLLLNQVENTFYKIIE